MSVTALVMLLAFCVIELAKLAELSVMSVTALVILFAFCVIDEAKL